METDGVTSRCAQKVYHASLWFVSETAHPQASRWLSRQRICLQCRRCWQMWVWSLGQEDALEEEMGTHSSILAWRITWTEEPGGPQSLGRKEWDTTEATENTLMQCPSPPQSISDKWQFRLFFLNFPLPTNLQREPSHSCELQPRQYS